MRLVRDRTGVKRVKRFRVKLGAHAQRLVRRCPPMKILAFHDGRFQPICFVNRYGKSEYPSKPEGKDRSGIKAAGFDLIKDSGLPVKDCDNYLKNVGL